VPDLWTDLLACLDIVPPTDAGTTVFEGRNQQLEYRRVFGGQLLARFNAATPGPPQFEMWMRTPAVEPALAPALAA